MCLLCSLLYRLDLHAGEVQACADAASERVQALEAQLDSQSTEAETAAAAAQAELESERADAAATLIAVRAELKASLVAAETELASTKVSVATTLRSSKDGDLLEGMHAWHDPCLLIAQMFRSRWM